MCHQRNFEGSALRHEQPMECAKSQPHNESAVCRTAAHIIHLVHTHRSTVNKDLLRMGITWEEVEVAAQNRSEWHRSVAQCIHLDTS